MCDKKKVNLPDLILAAICELQEKNGVEAREIAEFVAKKRGCKPKQIEGMVKTILGEAQKAEIICEEKGLYRIAEQYDDFPPKSPENGEGDDKGEKKQEGQEGEEGEEGQEGQEGQEENGSEKSGGEDENGDEDDPCACLKFSRECLTDDQEENRCPVKKKKKTCS